MNKHELIEVVAKEADITIREARSAIDATLNAIASSLKRREPVTLIGFGTFKAVETKERRGKIPGSDKEYFTPAKHVPRFIPGTLLKKTVAEA